MSKTLRLMLLALLLAGAVINYADRQIIAVLKPMLEDQLHWSDADYGGLVSAFQLAAAISYLFAGWFVDRVGLKWANPLGVGAWSLAAVSHGLVRTLAQFTVARVALGATEAVGTPGAVKAIATWFDARERSMALGVMNAVTNIGAIITPLAVPALALAVGWRMAFILVGGVGFLWVAAWIALTAGRDIDAPRDGGALRRQPRVPIKAVLRDRRTWAIAGAKALSDQVWWFLLFWMPDLFHRVFHLDMKGIGAPLATVYVCSAAGSLIGGYVSGRLLAAGMDLNRARKLTMLVAALLVTPVPLVLHVQDYWLAVALLGLTIASHQAFSANLFAVITDVVPASRVGSVTSLGAFAGNLAGMGVLALTGWLLARGGGYAPLLFLAAGSYLAALLWIHLLIPVLRPAQPDAA